MDTALTKLGVHEINLCNMRSSEHNSAPAELLVELKPWETLAKQSHILLIGAEGECLSNALRTAGLQVSHTRRYATRNDDSCVSSWPSHFDKRFSAAALRWPTWYGANESFLMALHGAAQALPSGAPLWIYGNTDEGINAIEASAISSLFVNMTTRRGSAGEIVLNVMRASVKPGCNYCMVDIVLRAPLQAWGRNTHLCVDGGVMPWFVYPGLFAGGVLDVGTHALIRALPTPPQYTRILDFACGSGMIAAVLSRWAPSLNLHLLDADAVAIEAARQNVPSAKRFFLSDSWPIHDRDGKHIQYDWIVSAPPLHHGVPDDFRVLQELIDGASSWLQADGILWMISQAQVPIGCLLATASYFGNISIVVSQCGRFIIWRAARGDSSVLFEKPRTL